METKRAALVYQTGIANVFEVKCFNLASYGREAKRLLQYDFRSCAFFARGLKEAGYIVKVLGCNMAGDITEQKWTDNLEDLPFSDKFVKCNSNNTL
jgi:hypothetical protein